MTSIHDCEYLLNLPKKVESNGNIKEAIVFNGAVPIRYSFTLVSLECSGITFQYDINQSEKNHFKLSLYLMYDDEKIGLFRVDYNGQHKNPEGIIATLPSKFHQYAGKWFTFNEPHIHYHVDGYKPLAWAVPLDEKFKIKELNDQSDVVGACLEFNDLINLQTKFLGNGLLL